MVAAAGTAHRCANTTAPGPAAAELNSGVRRLHLSFAEAILAGKAFVSHVGDESETARILKLALKRDFLGMLDVFISSDEESIAAGDAWLDAIDGALREAKLMLILCSPASVRRPWVNFEAGAAWMLKIPLIPLCHAGLELADLPMPLSSRQGLSLSKEGDLKKLYARIGKLISCDVPDRPFAELAQQLLEVSSRVEIGTESTDQLARDRLVKQRLVKALDHPRFKWRSLERVAIEAGIDKEIAADHLRAMPTVTFGKGKSSRTIVGLTNRVRS